MTRSAGGGLALAIAAVIGVVIVAGGVLGGWLAWRAIEGGLLPTGSFAVGVVLGLGLGAFVAFFVVFRDLGPTLLARRVAPTVEVILAPGYRGFVTVLFDPQRDALAAIARRRYRVAVPDSGKLLTGAPPISERAFDFVDYELRYPDGARAELAAVAMTGTPMGRYGARCFFVGTDAELERETAQGGAAPFDPDAVYRALDPRRAVDG